MVVRIPVAAWTVNAAAGAGLWGGVDAAGAAVRGPGELAAVAELRLPGGLLEVAPGAVRVELGDHAWEGAAEAAGAPVAWSADWRWALVPLTVAWSSVPAAAPALPGNTRGQVTITTRDAAAGAGLVDIPTLAAVCGVPLNPHDRAPVAELLRLRNVAAQYCRDRAPRAPASVAAEAVVRLCAYLYDGRGTDRPVGNAYRASGAQQLLALYVRGLS